MRNCQPTYTSSDSIATYDDQSGPRRTQVYWYMKLDPAVTKRLYTLAHLVDNAVFVRDILHSASMLRRQQCASNAKPFCLGRQK
jgi:hypothetical protein